MLSHHLCSHRVELNNSILIDFLFGKKNKQEISLVISVVSYFQLKDSISSRSRQSLWDLLHNQVDIFTLFFLIFGGSPRNCIEFICVMYIKEKLKQQKKCLMKGSINTQRCFFNVKGTVKMLLEILCKYYGLLFEHLMMELNTMFYI